MIAIFAKRSQIYIENAPVVCADNFVVEPRRNPIMRSDHDTVCVNDVGSLKEMKILKPCSTCRGPKHIVNYLIRFMTYWGTRRSLRMGPREIRAISFISLRQGILWLTGF